MKLILVTGSSGYVGRAVSEYGLMEEAEESIMELADVLSNDKPIDSIEGLIFRKK